MKEKVKKAVYLLGVCIAWPCAGWAAEKGRPLESLNVDKTFQGADAGKKMETKKYEGDLKANTSFSKTFNTGGLFKTSKAVFPDKKFTAPTLRMDQQYPVSSYAVGPNTTLRGLTKSPIESKSSPFSSKGTPRGFAKNFAVRPYAGPEAALFKQNVAATGKSLGGIKDLPDHSLTIDEVRELLNRETTGKSARSPLPESSEPKN